MRHAICLLLALSPAVAAADITGKPRVVDGDKIEIAGRRIHLFGIDAPEAVQRCRVENRPWSCGRNATLALAGMIGTNWIACRERGDEPGIGSTAVCRIAGPEGPDLARMMVAAGWALARPDVSNAYVKDEMLARRARRGVWRGDFVRPWVWRRGIRLAARDDQPGACRIKGDIGKRGVRVYHLPEDRNYARVRIDAHAGERWFCTETEARAAGWRKARR
jgi:endonuclease YncB( thermonuclease family)